MSVTTLCGSNSYEISLSLNQRLEQFLNHSGNDDSGIERIDATTIDDASGGEIINRLMSPSLFATRKLVVIRDLSKNTQLSEQFIEWLDGNTQQVVLAHLSEENNTPEIALGTVLQILRRANMSKKCPQVRFRVAPRHSPHELIVLREE